MTSSLAVLRVISAILVAAWLAPVLTAGLAGVGVPMMVAVALAVIVAGGAAVFAVWQRRGADWILDVLLAAPRIWIVVIAIAAIATCVTNARLTIFMIDSSRVSCSYAPSDPFRTGHSCFSAYSEGARLAAAGGINIYESERYTPNTSAGARRLIGGNLRIDAYHYPPPFLLAPAAIRLAAPEFGATRAVWFMLQSLLIATALVVVSRWIGGAPGAWAAALGWLVLASPAVMLTIQQGNFQVTVFSLAAIAFVLIATGRELSGAAILAYAAVAKIVPGVLVVFLLTARRWRAAIYTAAFSLVLCVLTIAAFGWAPMSDFLFYELPRIASGEAFPQTEMRGTPHVNLSVYGETVRLRALFAAWFGVHWFGPGVGRQIAAVYGLMVVLLTAACGWMVWKRGWLAAARGEGGTATATTMATTTVATEMRMRLAQIVLALLSLMAFRSPFVGFVYGYIGTLWLLTLLAAGAPTAIRRAAWLAGFAVVAAAMALMPSPTPPPSLIPPPQAWIVITSVMFSAVLVLNLAVVVRAGISGGRAGGRPYP